ncbi:MAG: type III-B CRISPR module-associated Cmr3 family protein, partial [Thiotrichaceae bacterium]
MNKKTISFSAIDSWFFRETRPMDANGESQSIFPPGIRTVSGAIRTWIGEQQHVDWQDFKTNKNNPLRGVIGSSKEGDLGALTFKGVWISRQGKRLYPTPLHLMKKEQQLYKLQLAENTINCDLGKNIRLPELSSEEARGSKPLEKTWIDEETFQTILNDETLHFSKEHFFTSDSLFCKEPRTGIARNNTLRTVREGLLYQTQHIRPESDIRLEVDVSGLPDTCTSNTSLVRLGGESRAASLQVNEKNSALPTINTETTDLTNLQGIIIYLLSPLQMQYESYKDQPLPDFIFKEQSDQASYWQGNIEGVDLKLHGAVVGKAIRDGGWDMAKHQPRDDRSLIPAG